MIISIFFDVVSIGAIFPFLNELLGNNSSNFDFFTYEIFNDFVETQNRLLFFSIIIFIFFFFKKHFFIYLSKNFNKFSLLFDSLSSRTNVKKLHFKGLFFFFR